MKTCTERSHVCYKPFSTPVLTLLIPGRHAQRSSWVINRLNAHADTRENAFPKFMHQVRHGISTTFELLPCQSRVARQTLSNLIVLRTKLKTLIQTSRFCRAYVELNQRIKFGKAEARRMNWAYVACKLYTRPSKTKEKKRTMRIIS